MRRWTMALALLVCAQVALAEKGHLPPPPEENYNSMVLDYIVNGAVFDKKDYSDNWTRQYTYRGKLDPSFGGVLRVTGNAQWLTYPGPDKPYPWTVSVTVTAGTETKTMDYSPKTKTQSFDVSVPIGNAQDGSFSIRMSRSSDSGSRNMGAEGTMHGRAITGPADTQSVSVTGAALSEQLARDLMAREMASADSIRKNQVLYSGNDQGVMNGGKSPRFTLRTPTRINFVMNYHYNNGQGASPGTIGFRRSDGKMFGPWPATAVNKVYWILNPQISLPAGTYEVIDSDPASWSQNGPNGYGHVLIKGGR